MILFNHNASLLKRTQQLQADKPGSQITPTTTNCRNFYAKFRYSYTQEFKVLIGVLSI
jgi:hypothetical protein